MAKSQQAFNKLEKQKKKAKKKQDKLAKREENKKNKTKGADLESMMAYVDEFGNIVDTPPDPTEEKEEIKLEDIQISVSRNNEEPSKKKGKVEFFNPDKGFGFIIEKERRQKLFFHINDVEKGFDIKDNDFVEFDIQDTPRGKACANVTKA
ncbi:cold shock domain-containing protein [Flammeovirga yaeyamensis]|uniref:Cold shock domain-containing protein n=1 Tax=Flammeovirga yaeyamensis TaxID=367791 RepID=A0AAX1N551_9BACT|nr:MULTISPECIES: cold shock domain-containing protein [Flammeovirga]ANQ49923.1 cold shock domain-containing protein [Flammeovirga sp. MY04]MBB3701308.1 cold shock CspA family protein [Flammeovirga yaeyamensis]NMF38223.1 cold shock domain-containing protein [Flammeovirga yaeyamensis]QWG02635.1 cold shock domain-containing protein [Flammeovirga yaeyamensis]